MPFQNPRKAKFIPIAVIPTSRAWKYGHTDRHHLGVLNQQRKQAVGEEEQANDQGTPTANAISSPALRRRAVSLRSDPRRAAGPRSPGHPQTGP